jgi:spore germination protein GerM
VIVRANTLVVAGALVAVLVGGGIAFRMGLLGASVDGTHVAAPAQVDNTPNPNVVVTSGKEHAILLRYYVVKQTSADPVLVSQVTTLRVAGTASIWRQARTSLTALMDFPRTGSELQNPLPAGSRVLGVHVDNGGIATVDLSPQFKNNFNGGAREEQVTIYAIVNTVGAIKGITGVRFAIAGKPIDEFAGHLDLSDPLTPDESLIESAS